jgi:hypothetical protein
MTINALCQKQRWSKLKKKEPLRIPEAALFFFLTPNFPRKWAIEVGH